MGKTIKKKSEHDVEMAELYKKLKSCDPDIQQHVTDLTAINEKLHKENIKCLADKISLQNRVKILEQELSKRPQKSETFEERLIKLTQNTSVTGTFNSE
jgi:uncharacterized protein YjgD (DUF1641 family)